MTPPSSKHGSKNQPALKDYYRILEVHPEASREVIDRAYRALARKYHPDAYPAERQQWANLMMQEINEAHDVLTDPGRRAAYARYQKTEFWRVFWREGLSGLSRRWAGKG
ncbi:MAG: DnaJ domain-containing protein [Thermoleophilia bacterium]|nr:DnaJ domain-containing protein [Thermoleophilia bacterium]